MTSTERDLVERLLDPRFIGQEGMRREAADALASIRAERDMAVAALMDARGELDEAADKFWVIHCNHPGIACGRAQGEDKEFLATMSTRMKAARDRAARAIAGEQKP